MACSVHGTEAGGEMWICPVCGKERCEECEYFVCSVDGVKKDASCSFKCSFCESMAGLDQKVECSECKTAGCSSCISQSGNEALRLCPDCGTICSACKKTFPKGTLSRCSQCSSEVCSECSITTCEECGAEVCRQHSYLCGGCNKYYCKKCFGAVDSKGGEMICKSCSYKCPQCGKSTYAEKSGICSICNSPICESCALICEKDNKQFCNEHAHKCSICQVTVCNNHSKICPSCGTHACLEHFTGCLSCGLEYCEKCINVAEVIKCNPCSSLTEVKDAKVQVVLSELIEKNPDMRKLSGWEYHEGKNVYLFYGKSLTKDAIIAVDKNTKEIISTKKRGFIDKILNR